MSKKSLPQGKATAAVKLARLVAGMAPHDPATGQPRLTQQNLADAIEAGLLTRNQAGNYELTVRARLMLEPPGVAGARPVRGKHRPAPQSPRGKVVRRSDETPLEWLFKHRDKSGSRWISEAQYEAGCRLGTDFNTSRMAARVTMNWELGPQQGRSARPTGTGALEHSERAAAAADRTRTALAAVGPELAGVLVDVCCFEHGLEAAERAAGWPARSCKVVLKLALECLARHYGLVSPPNRHKGIVHWGSNDFRPSMDPT